MQYKEMMREAEEFAEAGDKISALAAVVLALVGRVRSSGRCQDVRKVYKICLRGTLITPSKISKETAAFSAILAVWPRNIDSGFFI